MEASTMNSAEPDVQQRKRTFSALPKDVQVVALWLGEQFGKDGTWPTNPEVRVFCFDKDLDLDRIQQTQGVFVDIHRGNQPSLMGLVPWVLQDMSVAPNAFAGAQRLYGEGLQRVRNAKGYIRMTSAEVAEFLGIEGVKATMDQLRFILSQAHFTTGEREDGEWAFEMALHCLKKPLPPMDEVLLQRPVDYSVYGGQSDVGPVVGGRRRGRPSRRATHWVFVGSTWEDLGEKYRPRVLEALLHLRMLPLGMEQWSSAPHPSIERSMGEIAEATAALFVIGERWGSPARPGTDDPRSFTETEYDEAKAKGLDVFAFVSDPKANLFAPAVLDPENANKQQAFRERVRGERHARYFLSPDQLKTEVMAALVDWERGSSRAAVDDL
jgi:Domain of unknown function (DUF4062)